MSNDTFAANAAEIEGLKQRVAAQDTARTARQKVLRKIDEAERQAMQAIANAATPSEGIASARRLQGIPVMRLVGSKFEQTTIEPVPFAAIAQASARRAEPANQHQAASGWRTTANKQQQQQQPAPPIAQDTLRERIQADFKAINASNSNRKAARFIAAVMVACMAGAFVIPYVAQKAA